MSGCSIYSDTVPFIREAFSSGKHKLFWNNFLHKAKKIVNYYIAGGAVRDLLLGKPIRDMDIVFEGPEQCFLQEHPDARMVKEAPVPIYISGGFEYTQISPGGLQADMLRRDFTINALALAQDGTLHAHPQAFDDLAGKIIRPASPTALHDDPVRAFRAARLAATFPEFAPHADTLAQMKALGNPVLGAVAPEQAGREVIKACSAARPGNFLRILSAGKCMEVWFEELAMAHATPAGPPGFHQNASVLEHIAMVMDGTAQIFLEAGAKSVPSLPATLFRQEEAPYTFEEARALAVWMALCHDLGKNTTPKELLPRHLGHEKRGEELAAKLGERLRLPRLYIKAGKLAARLHMKAGRYHLLRPGTKTDLLMAVHSAHLFIPFFFMSARDSHNVLLPLEAREDLDTLLAVKLPAERQNQGKFSGNLLRELRSNALAVARWHRTKKSKGLEPLF